MIGRTLGRVGLASMRESTRVSFQARAIRGMSSGKDLRFSTEARNLMLKGVDALADAVQVCLDSSGQEDLKS